jgi:endoglucanase
VTPVLRLLNSRFIRVLGVSLTLTTLCQPLCAEGFLRADGQKIVNEKGETVLLRGMGLGGWMLQEGYMLQLNQLGQQHLIRAKIEELIGEEDTQAFYDAWLANHTTKADIDAMATWGFNSVRLPMHYNLFTLPVEQEPVAGENTWLEKGFVLTDALLAWCKANNMYLILDLHATPGGQGNDNAISDRDPNKPSLWDSPANQQKMVELWRKLAQRYANEPWIGAYDIINEPNWGFQQADDKNGCKEEKNEPLRKLMMDTTKAIRAVDSKHMIIIEGNCWGNNYKGILPAWDSNMALSFHKYWNNNTQGDISGIMALREQYNVPIWLGESGENSNLWFTDAIRLMEKNGIGWAFWPLKKQGINNPLQIEANPGYAKVRDYLIGKGERPTAAEAKKALMQLAQKDVSFANNHIRLDVIDAMFRQPHSSTSIAFAPNEVMGKKSIIKAVDFDMGTAAYADNTAADYHVSTNGDWTVWNPSKSYRNDGVDIGVSSAGKNSPTYFVDNTEAGEWLEYRLNVNTPGVYSLKLRVKSSQANAAVSLILNNRSVGDSLALVSASDWQLQPVAQLELAAGMNTLRVKTVAGGYQLAELVFEQ